MDDERDRLVALLRHKLTELDARVVAYRRERADEFRRYADDLLKPVASDVVAEVAKVLDGEVAKALDSEGGAAAGPYAALYPGFFDCVDDIHNTAQHSILAPPPASRALPPRRTASPPPILYHTSGVPKEGPRRPPLPSPSRLQRENDFRGVFTPPFLPLLDSSSSSAPEADRVPPASSPRGRWNPDAGGGETAQAAQAAQAAVAPAAAAPPPPPPPPSPPPPPAPPPEPKLKSALRRTSALPSSRSSTPPSMAAQARPPPPSRPRRVRFALDDGEEVSPTSSPPPEATDDPGLPWLLHHDSRSGADDAAAAHHAQSGGATSAAGDTQPHLQGSILRGWGGAEAAEPQASTVEDGADTLADEPHHAPRRRSQILDDDDDDDFGSVPLSRKVSSSDRLRALSKMPLEDPSMWTVVDPDADAAAAGGHGGGAAAPPSVDELVARHSLHPSDDHGSESGSGSESESGDGEDEDDGDDEFVAMRSSDKRPGRLPTSPQATAPAHEPPERAEEGNGRALPSARPQHGTSHKAVQVQVQYPSGPSEDDPLFEFEADGGDGLDGSGLDGNEDVGYPLSRVSGSHSRFEDEDGGDGDADEPRDTQDEDGTWEPETRRVDDTVLAEEEKAALGIGTDGLDSGQLVINRHRPSGERKVASTAPSSFPALASRNNSHNRAGSLLSASFAASPPLGASVGSYRGRPLSIFDVVKDPRILEEAAELGDVDTFVGSIHDAPTATFSSLGNREKPSFLSSTPRSLTERMALEDARAFLSSPSRHH